jgi:hypothetical protein
MCFFSMSFLIYQNISIFLFRCTFKEAIMDPQIVLVRDKGFISGQAENNHFLLQTIKHENAC